MRLEKRIRYYWIAGLVYTVLMTTSYLYALWWQHQHQFPLEIDWRVLHTVLLLALCIGIYFRNRACGSAMLLLFLWVKGTSIVNILLIMKDPDAKLLAALVSTLITLAVLLWFFVRGTFALLKLEEFRSSGSNRWPD